MRGLRIITCFRIVTGTNDEKGTFTLKADDGGEYVITTGNIGDVGD